MIEHPLVSVRLVAHNHEEAIVRCLEGILMQRTDFPFEVIVADECSTDRMRDIVSAYAEQYPEKICVLPAEARLDPIRNSYRVQQACRGKYHAMIEGDDAWIDPLKLQTQANFMEARPDVSLCFHNVLILNEKRAATRLFFEDRPAEILDFYAACQMTLPMGSQMARGDVLATLPEWGLKSRCGDLLLRLWCAHHGKLGYIDRIMSVYRRPCEGLEAHKRSSNDHDDRQEVLREFDQETHCAHTGLIQREIARVQEERLRQRARGWYFLLRPRHVIVRFREYANWISRQKHLFG